MKISEVQKKLLDAHYPDGYVVPKGEEGHFHIMFVDIISNKGGRSVDKAVFQKYFPKEWRDMLRVIENPTFGMIVTGHNEYVIVHDPVEYAEEQAKEAKRKADEEAKGKADELKKAKAVEKMQEGRKKAAEAKKVKSGESSQSET